jgi:glycosyltransferase involved in cell wall biosynthesis
MGKPKNLSKKILTEKIEGITYIWIPSRLYDPNKNIERFMNLLTFFFRSLILNLSHYLDCEDVKAVIGSSPSIFSGFNAYRIAKRCSAKFIFEVRDIWPLSLFELKSVSKLHPIYILMKWFERHAYRKAHTVVSLLPNSKEYMIENGMLDSKFTWIPNGIDLELFSSTQDVSPKEIDLIPKKKFVVGYVGSLGEVNMMSFFIEAASKMQEYRNIHFIVIGNGPEKPKLIEKSFNLNNITFIDFIKKEYIIDTIKKIDICFISLPNRRIFEYGVSPNKLFDYMYAGKPILQAINSPGNPVIKSGCGITIAPESSDAIVEGILKLYNTSPEKLAEMGESGKKYVMENHDYRKLVEEYLKVL